MFLLALTPILLILFLMVGLRWGAARAGGAGYLAALAIAVLFFRAGPVLLAYAHAKAVLLALDVLLIIWAAFLLYRVADEAGAIAVIGGALPHLTPDRGMQALVIGWVFASFLQSVGGFGVPVAVIAPVLVGLGFPALAAVVIPSIGHGWAVTFGSLGSSFAALQSTTGLPSALLAPPAALFLGLSAFAAGWMVAHAAGGWRGVRRLFLPVALLGGVMALAQYLTVSAGFWNLGAFAAGLAGLAAAFPLARLYRGASREGAAGGAEVEPAGVGTLPPARSFPGEKDALDLRRLGIALSGYAALIAVILLVQLWPGLNQFLGRVVLSVGFPETRTGLGYVIPAGNGRSLVLFRHTGAVLVYAACLAYLIYRRAGRYRAGAAGRILAGTVIRVLASSVSIASMVTLAVVMEHAGMTDALARGLAEGVGRAFPLAAPWIGALGAFMTGSNTNSNVVFGALQLKTALLLGYTPAIILAGQTAGAALASVIAPTKIVVGASTAGMAGREGEVLRRLLPYTGLLVLLISLFTLLGSLR
jgi:lactate permease